MQLKKAITKAQWHKEWFLSYLHYFDLDISRVFLSCIIGIYSSEQVVRFLVEECHADVNTANLQRNFTALMLAMRANKSVDAVQVLFSLGADVNVVRGNEGTALDHAFTLIVKKQRHITAHDKHVAWRKVTMLLQAGAILGPNSGSFDSYLLRWARRAEKLEVISLLESRRDNEDKHKPKKQKGSVWLGFRLLV